MKNTRKLAGHAFVLLVIEADELFARVSFRWCKWCGLVKTSRKPHWAEVPVFMLPGDQQAGRSPPVCGQGRCAWEFST